METPGHKKSEKWENIWARSQLSGSSGWWQDGATGFTVLWVWVAPPLGGGLGVGGVGVRRGLRGLVAGRHALIHLNGFAHVTAKGRTWTRGWPTSSTVSKSTNMSLKYKTHSNTILKYKIHPFSAKSTWVILLSRLLRNLATQAEVYFALPRSSNETHFCRNRKALQNCMHQNCTKECNENSPTKLCVCCGHWTDQLLDITLITGQWSLFCAL